jgi:hypothetical protein
MQVMVGASQPACHIEMSLLLEQPIHLQAYAAATCINSLPCHDYSSKQRRPQSKQSSCTRHSQLLL